MRERVLAFLRLLIALALVWGSIAKAAGIDVFAVVDVIRYSLENPEALAAAVTVGYAWWKNENVTERAIRNEERNRLLEAEDVDYYEVDDDQA